MLLTLLQSQGSINRRALSVYVGFIRQIPDADLGTGKKVLVVIADGSGQFKLRQTTEGKGVIIDPTSRILRVITGGETLQS